MTDFREGVFFASPRIREQPPKKSILDRVNTKNDGLEYNYSHHRLIVEELDNANSIRAFSRFENKGHVAHFQCHFRYLVPVLDALHALGTTKIND